MRKVFGLLILTMTQACTHVSLNSSALTRDFSPLIAPGANKTNFEQDKVICLKEVQEAVGQKINENFAIIKFRNCLIQKGYVLLS